MAEATKTKITPKTRNLIISIICITILIAGIITSIVLATRKRFEMQVDNHISYNNHTTMKMLDLDKSLIQPISEDTNQIYNNGTMIVKEYGSELHGIYSLEDDKLIVDTEYPQDNQDAFGIKVERHDNYETLFRLTKDNGTFEIVNDEGIDTKLVSIDDEKMYSYKMSRNIKTTAKKSKVRVKIDKDFTKEKIEISNVEFVNDYHGEDYNYEIWKVTTSDAVVYQNIYKVNNGKRELIQTLGLTEGIGFTTPNTFSFFVSSEGNPLIQEIYSVTREDLAGDPDADPILLAYKYTLYDIEYNVINTLEIDSEILEKTINRVDIGDFTYFQTIEPGTEKKHTFFEGNNNTGEIVYINLKTYKINNAKATMKEISFDYIIEESYSKQVNSISQISSDDIVAKVATLSVREIEGKNLLPSKLVIVNEKLQTRDIDFVCEEITELSEDRFMTYDNEGNYYLIDEEYKLLKRFGQINSYFTTEDSILITINSTVYVCNYNGVIIKKYNSDKITNIHNERFYLVSEVVRENNVDKTRFYLEQCGHRNSNYIYETYPGMTSFTFNEKLYSNQLIKNDEQQVSIIVRIIEVNSTNFTYEFYNFENDLLLTAHNVPTGDATLTVKYSDNNSVIIYCDYEEKINEINAGKYFKLDR